MNPTKPVLMIAVAAGTLALTACSSQQATSKPWTEADRAQANAWAVREFETKQRDAAIIRQSLIRPDHFVDGTATLNPRGQRELAVLSRHFVEHSAGRLTIDRQFTPDGLYGQRVDAVTAVLTSAGVNTDAITFDTGTWSGHATPSTVAATRFTTPSDEEPYNVHKSRETK